MKACYSYGKKLFLALKIIVYILLLEKKNVNLRYANLSSKFNRGPYVIEVRRTTDDTKRSYPRVALTKLVFLCSLQKKKKLTNVHVI